MMKKFSELGVTVQDERKMSTVARFLFRTC